VTEPVLSADDDTPEQMRIRKEKRARLLDEGVEPYPVALPVTRSIAQVRATYPDLAAGVSGWPGGVHPDHRQTLLRHVAGRCRNQVAGDAEC